jgi:hypothetical protein
MSVQLAKRPEPAGLLTGEEIDQRVLGRYSRLVLNGEPISQQFLCPHSSPIPVVTRKRPRGKQLN